MVLKEKDDTVKLVMMKEIPVKTAGGHILRATAGYVRLTSRVKCLVIEEDEEGFIIGKDVLATLGIDIERQLEQLVENKDALDRDFIVGVRCDADVNASLEELIDTAVVNGFPRERREELRTAVLMFYI
ncbi:hypothetical protein PHYSODRAFT_309514 [Phytophthora sojae]|uniref:Uncharacterized protein n=1 Tax=Phytophthora sojae (strain P6497) TaxID=1094619 RepID=G4YHH3_PHYSP|nr:hypothetical protein PHYSODRAFT_309514 [Phytophthora sojae]EGZ28761.1 hypothetical protein PHYSODRAFT_309514 [Phytophthora sojae]|eukprot:XP_009516036.1 hypothetical protein PHYSODRAFT_309514 [Phytophthora sojae]